MSRCWMVIGVAVVLGLTGCASQGGAISESEFLKKAHALDTYADADASYDTRIVETAHNVCDAMKGEAEPDVAWVRTVGAMTDGGMDAGDAGAFITYSVAAYCPDQLERLPDA